MLIPKNLFSKIVLVVSRCANSFDFINAGFDIAVFQISD